MTIHAPEPGHYVTLKAETSLTVNYSGCISDWLYVGSRDAVKFLLTIDQGDEQQIELQIQTGQVSLSGDGQLEDPVAAFTEDVVGAVSAAQSTVNEHELVYVRADFPDDPTNQGFTWRNECGAHAVRLLAKHVGATAVPKLTVQAVSR